MKIKVLVLFILLCASNFFLYTNCSNSSSSGPGPEGLGNDIGSYLRVFVNDVEVDLNNDVQLQVGDRITVNGDLAQLFVGSKVKVVLFRDCTFQSTLLDWDVPTAEIVEYELTSDDSGNCTGVGIWIRQSDSDDPDPLPGDVQENILLEVSKL